MKIKGDISTTILYEVLPHCMMWSLCKGGDYSNLQELFIKAITRLYMLFIGYYFYLYYRYIATTEESGLTREEQYSV